jgi:EAL domain-containing protein (putative c-di-GMP-specific phosphodiesterase class I)
MQEVDLEALLGKSDRRLIVLALQSLHRERVAAWKALCAIAEDHGKAQPAMETFALFEPEGLLRRLGSAPTAR